jgi:hypothetical protein
MRGREAGDEGRSCEIRFNSVERDQVLGERRGGGRREEKT